MPEMITIHNVNFRPAYTDGLVQRIILASCEYDLVFKTMNIDSQGNMRDLEPGSNIIYSLGSWSFYNPGSLGIWTHNKEQDAFDELREKRTESALVVLCAGDEQGAYHRNSPSAISVAYKRILPLEIVLEK